MKAIILVGVSGSGKSTFAQKFVKGDGFVEINRDNIRFSEIDPNGDWSTYKFSKENEDRVTKIWNQQFKDAKEKRQEIVFSDTNLNIGRLDNLILTLKGSGYSVHVIVLHDNVESSIERDKGRKRVVGEEVIRKQAEKLYSVFDYLEKNCDKRGFRYKQIYPSVRIRARTEE